jgi:hypothetical protein
MVAHLGWPTSVGQQMFDAYIGVVGTFRENGWIKPSSVLTAFGPCGPSQLPTHLLLIFDFKREV